MAEITGCGMIFLNSLHIVMHGCNQQQSLDEKKNNSDENVTFSITVTSHGRHKASRDPL